MDIERAKHALVDAAPDELCKLLSRNHLTRTANKRAQQSELRWCQVHCFASDSDHAPGFVHRQRTQFFDLPARARSFADSYRSAAECKLDPRLQLVDRKWLADEVISAELKTDCRIFLPLRPTS